MSLYMRYLFTRGGTSHNLRPQFLLAISSLNMRMPPEKGGGGEIKSEMNWPCSIAWANLWNPACSLLAMQLHTTCWVLSRECGQQVAGELMKCQDGGREIACITYPQGALVVFPRISHTGGEYSRTAHTLKEKVVLLSIHNLLSLFFCTSVEMGAITELLPHCQQHYHSLQRSQAWRDLIACLSVNPFIKTTHYSLKRLIC